jgi:aspartate/methionine/tyrosine aminotransferase
MDTTARDLVQEFALAALEGRDCLEAMRRFRSAANKRRKTFVYGLDMTTDLAR